MFNNILIVCVGNICRSPMAQAMFARRFQGQGPVFSSAGIGALIGKPMDTTAQDVLHEHGLALTTHRARQVNSQMLHQADLILAMERHHLQHLSKMAPEVHGKTFLIGKWQRDEPIPDPYRQSRPVFEHVYQLLSTAVESWSPYLR